MTVRQITEAEAAVVERTLAVAATNPSASALIEQVRSLQVVGRCECGCASLDFRIPAGGEIAGIVADATARAPDGEHLGIIVWALHNELSGLEVYSYSDKPAPLPELTSICGYDGTGSAGAA